MQVDSAGSLGRAPRRVNVLCRKREPAVTVDPLSGVPTLVGMLIAITGTSDFYSAAVQIIPLFALVQLVERRSNGDEDTDPHRSRPSLVDALALWTMVAAASTGELVGFRALYWGHSARTDQWYVIAALVVAGLSVIIPAVWEPTIRYWHSRKQWRSKLILWFAGACIAWMIFVFAAVLHR
jgi:hypothetical protein